MTLLLNGLEVECVIGELPHERLAERPLRLDVELTLSDARASETDDIADAVDYAALAARIRAALRAARCKLIERAARLVGDLCLSEPGVVAATVTVTKCGCVVGLDSAAVRYSAQRGVE